MSEVAGNRGWVPTPDQADEMLQRLGHRRVLNDGELAYDDVAAARLEIAALMVANAWSLEEGDRMTETMRANAWLLTEEARIGITDDDRATFMIAHAQREEMIAEYLLEDDLNVTDTEQATREATTIAAIELAELFGRMRDTDQTAEQVLDMELV